MPNFGKLVLAFLMFATLYFSPSAALADTVVFDFENLNTTPLGSGSLTSLTLTRPGLTVTITRPGSRFDITDISAFGAGNLAPFGSRTLDQVFTDPSTPFASFIINFSLPLTSVSIDIGDFGSDTDMPTLQAFSGLDGTGTLLGTSTLMLPPLPGNPFTFVTPSVSAEGINSVRFFGGGLSPASAYYDNLTATFAPQPIPEPTTMLLLGTGLAGVSATARNWRRTRKRDGA